MKIVIIGGVAAGASAAARARRLSESAEIVILEKGGDVSFANCGLPYHIGGEIANRGQLLLQTPESLHRRLNLDVRVWHEAVAIDPQQRTVEVKCQSDGRSYREDYERITPELGAKPSISTRSWFRVCSRSSLSSRDQPPRDSRPSVAQTGSLRPSSRSRSSRLRRPTGDS